MKLSKIIFLLYVVSLFLVFPLSMVPIAFEVSKLDILTAGAGAIFCAICLWLLIISKGQQRCLFLLVLVSLYFSFVVQFLILIYAPHLYFIHGYDTSGALLSGISTVAKVKTLFYASAVIILIFLGARAGMPKRRHRHEALSAQTEPQFLYYHRKGFLILALLSIVILLFLNHMLGASRPVSEGSATYGYLTRFFPELSINFIVMYFGIKYWRKLSIVEKVMVGVYFILYLAWGITSGQRGVILRIPFYWLITLLVISDEPRLPKGWGIGLIVLILPILPPYLAVLSVIKDAHNTQNPYYQKVESSEITKQLGAVGYERVFLWIFGRFTGFQTSTIVLNDTPTGLEEYANPKAIFTTTLQGIIPDRFLPATYPSSGKIFGVFYRGLGWEAKYSGSWFLFGFLYAYFGYYGIALGFPIGWIFMKIFTYFRFRNDFFSGLAGFTLYLFGFSFIVSGNMDTLLSRYITELIICICAYLVLKIILIEPIGKRFPRQTA